MSDVIVYSILLCSCMENYATSDLDMVVGIDHKSYYITKTIHNILWNTFVKYNEFKGLLNITTLIHNITQIPTSYLDMVVGIDHKSYYITRIIHNILWNTFVQYNKFKGLLNITISIHNKTQIPNSDIDMVVEIDHKSYYVQK